MIEIDGIDRSGSKPLVCFWYRDIPMDAELDPGVVDPVVIKGSAQGSEVDVNFSEYGKLQEALNKWMRK